MFLSITLFALFASLFTLSKSALEFADPVFLVGSRMLFAGLALLTYQFFFKRSEFNIKWNYVLPLFLLGFLNIYITNVAEIFGINYMSSAKACLLYSLSPFVSALLAGIILKEKLNFKKGAGLAIGFLGIFPILLTTSAAESILSEIFFISWAEIAIFVAVVSSAYGWILLKKLVSHYGFSTFMANGISMTLGGTLALIHSYFAGENWTPIPVNEGSYWAFVEITLWMTIISNFICYNLYGYLLKRHSATFISLVGLVTPLFASLFGWYFLNEEITWHFFASMAIFSIGLTMFYQEELQDVSRNKAKVAT